MEQEYILSVYVDNHFGTLARVAGMFRRRGFNIDTLSVGETEDPAFSRITISFRGDEHFKKQLAAQLEKLEDVKKVKVLDRDSSVTRELVLIKIKNDPKRRPEVLDICEIFRARVIDYSQKTMTIEITGKDKLDAFIDLMRQFGIIEICRTGIVGLQRGSANIKED